MFATHYRELEVYQNARGLALNIFEMTKQFPPEERYSMIDQMRRSSRSVCANLAEAWRKRRYKAAFISKLSDSETEASETQVWMELAVDCGYLSKSEAAMLDDQYDKVIAQLTTMINHADSWLIG